MYQRVEVSVVLTGQLSNQLIPDFLSFIYLPEVINL